jgi:hypothetical protein
VIRFEEDTMKTESAPLPWIRPTLFLTGPLAMLLGLVMLLGWIAHLPLLVQIVPSFAPMQFNTALSFVGGGAALAAFSAVTLAQCLFDVSFGVDTALFTP